MGADLKYYWLMKQHRLYGRYYFRSEGFLFKCNLAGINMPLS